MIEIKDTDLPITVAEKLITATKDIKEELIKAANRAFGGDGTQDMFSDEELAEIAEYLICYCKHQEQLSNGTLSDIGYGLSLAGSYANDLTRLTKADICREFGDWYFSRIKLPEEEREKFTNEWNDLVRDYIAEMEQSSIKEHDTKEYADLHPEWVEKIKRLAKEQGE